MCLCVCACVLTVDDDLDHPEIDLSTGQDSSLAGVHALIGLFDAANLKAGGRMGEPHYNNSSGDRKHKVKVRCQVRNIRLAKFPERKLTKHILEADLVKDSRDDKAVINRA